MRMVNLYPLSVAGILHSLLQRVLKCPYASAFANRSLLLDGLERIPHCPTGNGVTSVFSQHRGLSAIVG
jgi:hypothetical protein